MQTNRLLITHVLFAALLLAGCASRARVGALQSESQSVELGDAESVRVEINYGAGNLEVTGGAQKLLEADFNYNVDQLKPEVEYSNSKLVVWQPEAEGLPDFRGISGFQNEWDLRFSDEVPMDLSVDIGAGTSNLRLAGLSLTGLDINLGAGISTVDLSGDWAENLDVSIDAGAAELTVRLPSDIGVRVVVDRGPTVIQAPGLTQNGNVYTNAAYGVSDVTLQLDLSTGIGLTNLLEID